MPNPSVVSGNTNSGSFTTGTSVTVSSTGSVTAGDLMFCVLTVGGASAPSALAPPAGWTTFLTTTANTSSGLIVTAIFYKAQSATGSFSGSFTWTTTATSGSWGFFVVNQPGALLVDGTVGTSQNASGTKTSPTKTPGTGNVNDRLICAIIGAVAGVDSITQPAGMTSIVNIAGTSTQPFFSIASLALASSAATGTKTWTVPTSQTCLGVSLLIQQGPLWGFNVVNDAAPALPSYENRVAARVGSIVTGDAGIEANFVPNPLSGFEPNIPPPRNGNPRIYQRGAGASGKSSFVAFNLAAWPDVLAWQPKFPLAGRRGAIADWEDGNENTMPVATSPVWWEIQSPMLRISPTPSQRGAAASGKSSFAAFTLSPWADNLGWQPFYPRAAHRVPMPPGDSGLPVATAAPTVFTKWGWEALLPPSRVGTPMISKRGAGASGKSTFAAFDMRPWTEVQSLQPPQYPRARQRYVGTKGSAQFRIFPDLVKMGWEVQPLTTPRPPRHLSDMLGDPGKAAAAAPPPPPAAGWEIQSPPIRVTPPKQRAAAAYGRSAFAAFNMRPFTEIQSWQPPRYPAPRQRYAATKGNVQFRIFPDFAKMDWGSLPDLPYPRAAHRGAMVPGDQGNQAKFVPPITGTILWGLDQTPFAKRNLYRAGTFTERDVETPLLGFFPYGWPIQPIQPGHPSPEKRSAGIARGDDGTQAQRINFFPAGWQVQPHQPQHPRPERAGSIMAGDPGNEAPFVFVSPIFIPDGYNPTPFMPRVRFARAGALARGEDGTEGLYSVWLPSGWQIADPLQRPRRGTAGAIQDEWRGEQPLLPATRWGFEFQSDLRRQKLRTPDQAATILVAGTTAVTVSWGDFNPAITLPTRRRANLEQASFVPGVLARFTWADIDAAMTFRTRRRTLIRAEFHIEGKFAFVPPLAHNFVVNPDNLLRRTLFNPGAAVMPFDGGWFLQRYVDVFFASSIITQASGDTLTTQAAGDTAVTAAAGQTVLSSEREGSNP